MSKYESTKSENDINILDSNYRFKLQKESMVRNFTCLTL